MCGVFGGIGVEKVAVEAALDRIAHRGPDGRGVVDWNGAVHGHVRLALRDGSEASSQPFVYDDTLLSWVGEVWNFRELRAAFQDLKWEFHTTGDTEVLAAGLESSGIDFLDRVEGMFAGAFTRAGETYLFRDRFGKVPLYALCNPDKKTWTWSTERKGWDKLGGYATAVPPGTAVRLSDGAVRKWYSIDRAVSASGPATPEKVLNWLVEGVEDRLDADFPVCVLASGGLDSSMVLGIAKHFNPNVVAYTAVLDPRSPDLHWARGLCQDLQVELREVRIDPKALTPHDFSEACRTIEVPSKAQSEIAALCIPLARRIAADGFKACLSGEGADELFGGYGNMCIAAARLDDKGWSRLRRDCVEKMGRGNFVRCNKAFMAAGVECRLPFMTRPLVESVLATGKLGCPPGKDLLKIAALQLLPSGLVQRPKATFQGGAGMDVLAARVVADPAFFYKNEVRSAFGRVTRD